MKENRFVSFFKKYFVNYFMIGVVLVLLSIVFKVYAIENIYFRIFSSFYEILGVSLFIASIFSYATSSVEFLEKVEDLLRNIVIKRDFLGNLDKASKKDAIYSIIKPTSEENKIYSNFDDYYKTFINKTLDVSKKSVRSDYRVDADVYYDTEKSMTAVKSFFTYRVYPSVNGYNDIRAGFMDYDVHSVVKSIKVYNKEKRIVLKDEEIKYATVETEAGKIRITSIPLNEIGKDAEYLNVEIEMIEYGHDHWILVNFQSLEPTDGFTYKLKCADELKICEYHTFVYGAKLFIDIDKKTNKEIIITCGEWINEGTGMSIVVSKGADCE